MRNGVAHLSLPEPSTPTVALAKADKPNAAPATPIFARAPAGEPVPPADLSTGKENLKTAIGLAAADAVTALGAALIDYEAHRRLSDKNRALGGETVARVVELRLATLGEMPDFGAVALAEGRRTLLARHGAVFRQHLDEVALDAALNELIGHILTVANEVTATEMAFRAN